MQAAGGRAYLVGGAVRDAYLGRPIKDLDLEVFGLHPEASSMPRSALSIDSVGQHFGVLLVKGYHIDIAVPAGNQQGPKHTDFLVEYAPDSSLAEAASRRDFTINALSYDILNDALHDPYGGLQDLQARRLRHVSQKFAEDPLRVLRGMQFIARFDLLPDPSTVQLCRQLSPEELPIERIESEWKKLILKSILAGLQFLMIVAGYSIFQNSRHSTPVSKTRNGIPKIGLVHTRHCMDAFARERIQDWGKISSWAWRCSVMISVNPYLLIRMRWRIRSPQHDRLGVPLARRCYSELRGKSGDRCGLPLVEQHMTA